MALQTRPQMVSEGPRHAIGTWETLLIHMATADTEIAVLAELDRQLTALAATAGGKIGVLALISGKRLPNAETGREVNRIFAAHGAEFQCTCVVNGVEGILGTAARGLAGMLTLVMAYPYPNNVVGSAAEATRWLGEVLKDRSGRQVTSAEVQEAVSDLQEQHRKYLALSVPQAAPAAPR